jgi:hypothetical protein
MVLLIIVSVFLWIAVYHLAKIHDELKFNFELKIIGVIWVIFIGAYIILGLIHKGQRLPWILIVVVCCISFLVSFGMPMHLAIVKPAGAILGVESLDNIDKLLKDREAMGLFYKFLQKRLCTEGYFFIAAVERYRSLDIDDVDGIRTQFTNIKDKFIGNGAPMQINIPDHMARAIHSSEPTLDVFNEAFDENKKLLATDVFPAFKHSPEVKAYATKIKRERGLYISE